MAALTDTQRRAVWASFMEALSGDNDNVGALTKADARATLDAIDDWVVAMATSFNSAIPQPARGLLSASQKARALMFVVEKRYVEGA